jgi:osmotically-inducible protein OsmY
MNKTGMNKTRSLYALGVILTLSGALGACAAFKTCDSAACRDDGQITSNVQSKLNQSADLGAPYSIKVQTIDRVVYLNGQVDGGFEKRTAGSQAEDVPGVKTVVNDIAVLNK